MDASTERPDGRGPGESPTVSVSPPQVVIVAGPNGAGKSTVAPDLLQGALAVDHFLNADQIASGLSGFAPETAARKAGRIMLDRIDELVRERRSFAFESTLSGRTVARRIEDFRAAGYAVRINYLWLDDPDLAVRRVKQRARSGGHDIPEPDIRRRFWRSLRNFDDAYASLATSWRLYDSSVSTTPAVAVRRERQSVTVLRQDRWREFQASVDLAHRRSRDQR